MKIYYYLIKNKELLYSHISKVLVPLLIFLVIFAPVALKSVKTLIIGVLLLISLLMIDKNITKKIDKRILNWLALFSITNLFFLAIGNWDNIGVFRQLLPTNVIWPILYLFVLIFPLSKYVNEDLTQTFKISLVTIELFLFYVYLSFIEVIPRISLLELPLGQTINSDLGYVDFFSPSITSLFFLVPFFLSYLMIKKVDKKQFFFMVNLVLFGLIISLITGRRTLIALIFLSPLLTIVMIRITSHKKIYIDSSKIKRILFLSFIFLIVVFFVFRISGISLRINNLDNELVRSGTSIRTEQFKSLINGWKKAPIFGVGLGVNADVVRSEAVPGAYELTYVARLFQTGLVGFSIYVGQIYWIIKKLILLSKSSPNKQEYVIPTLIGFLCLLLAEFTNPYLASFDGMWIFFYALAIINNSLIAERTQT